MTDDVANEITPKQLVTQAKLLGIYPAKPRICAPTTAPTLLIGNDKAYSYPSKQWYIISELNLIWITYVAVPWHEVDVDKLQEAVDCLTLPLAQRSENKRVVGR